MTSNDMIRMDPTWTADQKREFTRIYTLVKGNQGVFLHPKAAKAKPRHWDTTAWNVAWVAVSKDYK